MTFPFILLSSFPAAITAIEAQLESAKAITSQANQTVKIAGDLTTTRKQEMSNMYLQAEGAKFNTTEAQAASLDSKRAVDIFKVCGHR